MTEPKPDICLETQDLEHEFAAVERRLAEDAADDYRAFEGFTTGQRLIRAWWSEGLGKGNTWGWSWEGVGTQLEDPYHEFHTCEYLDDGYYHDPATNRRYPTDANGRPILPIPREIGWKG